MAGRLQGKKALVTGGARGIGGAIATAFAREGADVAVLDLKIANAEAKTAELKQFGVKTVAVAADVSNQAQVEAAVAAAIKELGQIDILVNNAGIDTTSVVTEMSTSMWDEMMAVNLRSVFLCTRAVLKPMIDRKFGRIINIASQLGHKGAPEMAHYAAAKAGVIGFTKSLAYEVARDGVTANAICPGPIETELYRGLPEEWRKTKLNELPIRRAGQVTEIAPTAVLLASEEGAYYVGATMNPNGGDVML
ncbi:3-oxoacyl-ACP reductase FabG (plasmid) [Bradyrhizobium sp. 186]|uniref:SDR family NAD(P)-dependent oxidoreductase n=1 Tax=Bradyrhizobium sp. 186 TaxID=2782654 RepID=UPI002000FCBD|nr:3-oxoacyl-ACP reductase FabG [Bradyrhizobium sp. 186]UPK40800.1 3-oxoacyl-ACP reductase FabG [Bradyrhizobium sp. 186]